MNRDVMFKDDGKFKSTKMMAVVMMIMIAAT